MAEPTLLLFDIGGVLLTDGWDRAERAAAARRFGLDAAALEAAHQREVVRFESGLIGWAEYRDRVVTPPLGNRAEAFLSFLQSNWQPHPAAIEAVRRLRMRPELVIAALSNESREFADLRADRFGLRELFHVFFVSGYTGLRKPDPAAYRQALLLTHRSASEALFVDDREENVAAAEALGIRSIRLDRPDRLREELLARGVRGA